jgi:hypothetical protein
MRVQVLTLRKNGRNLNRNELSEVPCHVGFLRIRENRDLELNRPLLQARLLDPTRGNEADLLPALEDAKLLMFEKNRMRVTGIERLPDFDVAQTWEVRFDDEGGL